MLRMATNTVWIETIRPSFSDFFSTSKSGIETEMRRSAAFVLPTNRTNLEQTMFERVAGATVINYQSHNLVETIQEL